MTADAATNPERPAVTRAVILAAGFGTRLRPITNAIPKEMLPIGRKPVLEHVIDEARAAGIGRVLLVVSPGKETIRRYFGDGEGVGVPCDYVVQPEMRGIADAVLRAEDWVANEPFLVAFGDCIIEGRAAHPTARLLAAHRSHGSAATALCEAVSRERTRHYGILEPWRPDEVAPPEPFAVRGMVEKPEPSAAPSTWAVAARWCLDVCALPYLHALVPGANGETNLPDAIPRMVADALPVWACPLGASEARRDIGRWSSYLVAAAAAAAADPEAGAEARRAVARLTADLDA